jgi:hypothetical protein
MVLSDLAPLRSEAGAELVTTGCAAPSIPIRWQLTRDGCSIAAHMCEGAGLGAVQRVGRINDAAETCRRGNGGEPACGLLALYKASVIGLRMIMEGAIGAGCRQIAKAVSAGAWVCVTAVGGDVVVGHPRHRPGRVEAGLGRR